MKLAIKQDAFRQLLLIIAIGISYVIIHEMGHYVFAQYYGLHPYFVAQNGEFFLALGVEHNAGTAVQEFYVIFGATLLPMVFAIASLGLAYLRSNEMFLMAAEIYLILILINLIPIPGMNPIDANRIETLIWPLF